MRRILVELEHVLSGAATSTGLSLGLICEIVFMVVYKCTYAGAEVRAATARRVFTAVLCDGNCRKGHEEERPDTHVGLI